MSELRQLGLILAGYKPGSIVTIDDLREPLTTAVQVRPNALGPLLSEVCHKRLLLPTQPTRPSTHPPANGRRVLEYYVLAQKATA